MLFANRTLAVRGGGATASAAQSTVGSTSQELFRHAVNVTDMRGKAALIGLAAPPSIAGKLGRLRQSAATNRE